MPSPASILFFYTKPLFILVYIYFGFFFCLVFKLGHTKTLAMLNPSAEEAKKAIDSAVLNSSMVILIGRCSVTYKGRAGSKLARGERLLLIKEDGAFMVHQNRKLPPVNYQPPGSIITTDIVEGNLLVKCVRRKTGEVLEVLFPRVYRLLVFELKDDEAIKVSGMERHLADELRQRLDVIEKGLKLLKGERHVVSGSIDIMAEDSKGRIVALELKRRKAGLSAVSQLRRYIRDLRRQTRKKVRGVLCAPGITPNARKYLESEGLEFRNIEVDVDRLKRVEKRQKALSQFTQE